MMGVNSRGLALMWTGRPEAGARDRSGATTAARAAGIELAEINAAVRQGPIPQPLRRRSKQWTAQVPASSALPAISPVSSSARH